MTGKSFQSTNHATNGQILLQWMNVRHIFPIKKSCQKNWTDLTLMDQKAAFQFSVPYIKK